MKSVNWHFEKESTILIPQIELYNTIEHDVAEYMKNKDAKEAMAIREWLRNIMHSPNL